MKTKMVLIALLALVMLAVMPASNAVEITPTGAMWVGGGPYDGHNASFAIDGLTSTYAQQASGGSVSNYLQVNFTNTSGTEISYCMLTQNSGSTFTYTGYTYGASYSQSIVGNGTPQRVWVNDTGTTPYATFRVNTAWTWINEVKCYNGVSEGPPSADFYGNPLNVTAGNNVYLYDNSTGSPTSYHWIVSGPESPLISGSNSNNATVYMTVPGNYSVSLTVSNTYGEDTETKTDYISVSNNSGTVSTTFYTVSVIGNKIVNSAINLQDVETGNWTNVSTPSGGQSAIYTLLGQHINAYATALGYQDADLLGVDAAPYGGGYYMWMIPSNVTNVSAGNVTLYVYAQDAVTHKPLKGASIGVTYGLVDWEGPTGGQLVDSQTNDNGLATFTAPNDTMAYLSTSLGGYESQSSSIYTGTANGGAASVTYTFYLSPSYVTTTATQVPTICDPVCRTLGPTETIPPGWTPQETVLPGCENPNSAECRAAHGNAGLNVLAEHMDDLILLCVVMTMLYLMGIKLG